MGLGISLPNRSAPLPVDARDPEAVVPAAQGAVLVGVCVQELDGVYAGKGVESVLVGRRLGVGDIAVQAYVFG